jgi:hypothetical protein
LNLEEVINNDVMKVNSSIKISLPDLTEEIFVEWSNDGFDMKVLYNMNKATQPFFVLTLFFFSVTLGLTIQNYIHGNKKRLRRSAFVTFIFLLFTMVFYTVTSVTYRRLLVDSLFLASFDYISVSYSKSAAGLMYLTFALYFLVFIKVMIRGEK